MGLTTTFLSSLKAAEETPDTTTLHNLYAASTDLHDPLKEEMTRYCLLVEVAFKILNPEIEASDSAGTLVMLKGFYLMKALTDAKERVDSQQEFRTNLNAHFLLDMIHFKAIQHCLLDSAA